MFAHNESRLCVKVLQLMSLMEGSLGSLLKSPFIDMKAMTQESHTFQNVI